MCCGVLFCAALRLGCTADAGQLFLFVVNLFMSPGGTVVDCQCCTVLCYDLVQLLMAAGSNAVNMIAELPRGLLLFSVLYFTSHSSGPLYSEFASPLSITTGDLLIQLEVAEDPYFKRQDADVHVEVPITLTQVRVNWGCWAGYMSIVTNSCVAAVICC
jgi:hypothetical protein